MCEIQGTGGILKQDPKTARVVAETCHTPGGRVGHWRASRLPGNVHKPLPVIRRLAREFADLNLNLLIVLKLNWKFGPHNCNFIMNEYVFEIYVFIIWILN